MPVDRRLRRGRERLLDPRVDQPVEEPLHIRVHSAVRFDRQGDKLAVRWGQDRLLRVQRIEEAV